MNKNYSPISNTACLSQRALSFNKYKLNLKSTEKTSIPSLGNCFLYFRLSLKKGSKSIKTSQMEEIKEIETAAGYL